MRIVVTRQALRAELGDQAGRVVGLVPTMGALHAGHASLFDAARARSDLVVASIFVNPLQFAPGEDLSRYPRTLDADLEVCREHGVDLVFTPDVETVYPGGEPQVRLDPGPLGHVLEGAVRPGHFSGMLTVVAKLLNLVGPQLAVFGEKDYQQLVLIERMVADLCLRVEVVGAPTVRDPDGLALSSRNRYLSAAERHAGLALSRALAAGRAAADGGSHAALLAAGGVLVDSAGLGLDYLVLRAPDLGDLPTEGPARMLIAATAGTTRLIDNVALTLAPTGAVTGTGER